MSFAAKVGILDSQEIKTLPPKTILYIHPERQLPFGFESHSLRSSLLKTKYAFIYILLKIGPANLLNF
jgi:hypothetical protein